MFERLSPEQHDTLDDVPEPAENAIMFGHRGEGDRLAAAYAAGKLHHAMVLAGPQGIGKATFAFHLAHHLLKHPDPGSAPDRLAVPDPQSSLYRLIANGGHPSILYLTRPLNEKTKAFRSAVTVEEIRKVSRFLSLTAHDGGYRIVIVDPADDMNANAANALLKNLEEPPRRTLFILISHVAGGLLPTIRSRCQTLRLHPLSDAEFAQALGHIGIDEVSPGELAQRAGGSVREAVLLTRYGGLEIAQAFDALMAVRPFGVAAGWKLADAVSGKGQAIQFTLFNRHLLDSAAAMARRAAEAGDLVRAERLSAFWQEATRAVAETETYNLDKRQHVAGLVRRMHEMLHGR